MPIFRRFDRPGLLGAVTHTAIISGTAALTARAIGNGPTPVDVSTSLTDRLSLLSKLHSAGDLSDDEFALAKAKLLSGG
jgi:hypothetical protein